MSFIEQLQTIKTVEHPMLQISFLQSAATEYAHYKNLHGLIIGLIEAMENNPVEDDEPNPNIEHWPHLVLSPVLICSIVPPSQRLPHLKALAFALEHYILAYEQASSDGSLDRLMFEAKSNLSQKEETQNESMDVEY